RRRHTSSKRDWSSDVCSSDLTLLHKGAFAAEEREKVLHSFSDQVADRVLSNNYSQNVVLGEARAQTESMSGTYGRMLSYLEKHRSEERRVGKEWGYGWVR